MIKKDVSVIPAGINQMAIKKIPEHTAPIPINGLRLPNLLLKLSEIEPINGSVMASQSLVIAKTDPTKTAL